MKLFIYLFCPALLFLCSCTKNVRSSQSGIDFQKLSSEIEHSEVTGYSVSTNTENLFSVNTSNPQVVSSEKIILIEKKEIYKPLDQKATTRKQHPLSKKFIKKQVADEPLPVRDKKDSIFWKIGQGMSKVGLILLTIFGGIGLSFNSSGSGVFLFSGALIGLAILILSLPFFLLAIITSKMKKNPTPPSNADEI